MIESARRGNQQVGAVMNLEQEQYNARSEERGRHRDGEAGATSKLKTSLVLPTLQGIPEDMEGGRKNHGA